MKTGERVSSALSKTWIMNEPLKVAGIPQQDKSTYDSTDVRDSDYSPHYISKLQKDK